MYYGYDFYDNNNDRLKEIILWIVEILAVILIAFLLVRFGMEKTTILGDSMETTLQDQDKVIINKLSYLILKPKRFDVVVFKQNGAEHSYYNIKRVIGLPGEKVRIKDGVVSINGKTLKEKVPVEKMINAGVAEEDIVLDEHEYFVLGDNRNNSEDSRFANIGNVISDDIIGKAWFRIKPFGFISRMNKIEKIDKAKKETEQ